MKKFLITVIFLLFLNITFSAAYDNSHFNYSNNINTTKSEISESQKILNAIELIKGIPNGFELYQIIIGENPSKVPVRIEFKDLSVINERYANYETVGYLKKGIFYIYINDKYENVPDEVIAALITGRLPNLDTFDSINEEIYSWTLEAAAWTCFTYNNPNLEKLDLDVIKNRENLLKSYFVKGNYTDKYIRKLVESNSGYKNLPQTSPGYETVPRIDTSGFDAFKH